MIEHHADRAGLFRVSLVLRQEHRNALIPLLQQTMSGDTAIIMRVAGASSNYPSASLGNLQAFLSGLSYPINVAELMGKQPKLNHRTISSSTSSGHELLKRAFSSNSSQSSSTETMPEASAVAIGLTHISSHGQLVLKAALQSSLVRPYLPIDLFAIIRGKLPAVQMTLQVDHQVEGQRRRMERSDLLNIELFPEAKEGHMLEVGIRIGLSNDDGEEREDSSAAALLFRLAHGWMQGNLAGMKRLILTGGEEGGLLSELISALHFEIPLMGGKSAKSRSSAALFSDFAIEGPLRRIRHGLRLQVEDVPQAVKASARMKLAKESGVNDPEDYPHLLFYWEPIRLSISPSDVEKKEQAGSDSTMNSSDSSTSYEVVDEVSETELMEMRLKRGWLRMVMGWPPASKAGSWLSLLYGGRVEASMSIQADDQPVGKQPALIYAWSRFLDQLTGGQRSVGLDLRGEVGDRQFHRRFALPPMLRAPSTRTEMEWTRWLEDVIQTRLKIVGLRDATLQLLLQIPALGPGEQGKRWLEELDARIHLPSVAFNICIGGKDEPIGIGDDF